MGQKRLHKEVGVVGWGMRQKGEQGLVGLKARGKAGGGVRLELLGWHNLQSTERRVHQRFDEHGLKTTHGVAAMGSLSKEAAAHRQPSQVSC